MRDAGVLRVLLPGGKDAFGLTKTLSDSYGGPSVPTVLVGYGYFFDPSEAELFTSTGYITFAANAIADAIEAHLRSDRPGNRLIGEPRLFDLHSHAGFVSCTDPGLG